MLASLTGQIRLFLIEVIEDNILALQVDKTETVNFVKIDFKISKYKEITLNIKNPILYRY